MTEADRQDRAPTPAPMPTEPIAGIAAAPPAAPMVLPSPSLPCSLPCSTPRRCAPPSVRPRACPSPNCCRRLLDQARLAPAQAEAAEALALRIAAGVRQRVRVGGRAGLVQGLLQEFALSSQEGVALMCLAEALLRIPDAATRDALIRDKIGASDWQAHLGRSPSLFVNAATWGLLFTGKLVATHSDAGLSTALRKVVARGGEPLIRKGVDMAMRLMGEQFVTGETIEQALVHARSREAQGFRYSYDMLGEAAMTARDAAAVPATPTNTRSTPSARAAAGKGVTQGPGISIKLSALHPRYSRAQVERVMAELLSAAAAPGAAGAAARHRPEHRRRGVRPARALARPARAPVLRAGAGRLERHRLRHPGLPEALPGGRRPPRRPGAAQRPPADGPAGQGRVLGHRDQARPDRRPRRLPGLHPQGLHRRRLHRLRAQAAGRARRGLPAVRHAQRADAGGGPRAGAGAAALPTSTATTPTSSSACTAWASRSTSRWSARRRRAGSARPAASTRRSARTRRCSPTWCGACWRTAPTPRSSTASPTTTWRWPNWCEDPVRTVRGAGRRAKARIGLPHPAIPLPRALYGAGRARTRAASTWPTRPRWRRCRRRCADAHGRAARLATAEPLLGVGDGGTTPSRRGRARCDGAQPGRPRRHRRHACATPTPADVDAALACAVEAASRLGRHAAGRARARCSKPQPTGSKPTALPLIALLVREAGKTCANGVAEVREAVDFLRYYAQQVRDDFDNATPPAARAGGLHQPVELPAGDLHRPGRRGAGRRQRGAGQAGRADAADRRRGGARAARRRRAARRAAAAARPRRDASAPRWSPTRGCRACSSPARPTWRGCCSARWPVASAPRASRCR